MRAYLFFIRCEADTYELVGILPERRKVPERITPESIINWEKEMWGPDVSLYDIFNITVTIDENTGEISPFPLFIQHTKVASS